MELDQQLRPQWSPERRLSVLLGLLLATTLGVEYLTRVMHDHRSETLHIEAGLNDALLIRHSPEVQHVLFAGNSLIFDDLAAAQLQQGLGPRFVVHLAGVPGSTYDDWLLGLHALFARGSQPDVVVFSISPSQFVRGSATTPTPVTILWRSQDILAYQRQVHLSPTQFTDLLLEHTSTYYSLRNTIRIYFRKFIPGYEAMVYSWTSSSDDPAPADPSTAELIDEERLARLAAVCGPRRQLVLLLSPTNQVEDKQLEPALKAATAAIGIPTIEPVREREWPLSKFRADGYHLTPDAASEFSKLVANDLRGRVGGGSQAASGQ